MGIAHSSELWYENRLVGGAYGICLGKMFFGESMFHVQPDASKAAVVHLTAWLRERGVEIVDCQQTTPHMLRLGAEEIPRAAFLARLYRLCRE